MSDSADPRFTPPQHLDGRRATFAYADLMFAFGFARLGDPTTAEHLRDDATRQLDAIETNREFHRLARSAFDCRIAEALRGDPHTGTLDDRCPEVIAALLIDDLQTPANSPPGEMAYVLGRVIKCSEILEPSRRYEPYRGVLLRVGVTSLSAWSPRDTPPTQWNHLIETADSAQTIWNSVRTAHEASHPRTADVDSTGGGYSYWQRVAELLSAARSLPIGVVRRFLTVVFHLPPRIGNAFATAPYFARIHFAVVDSLVLAVAGTGPLPSEAERPERLELLRSVRPAVMKWVETIPAT